MKKLILITLILAGLTGNVYSQVGESEPPYGMGHLEAYSLFYENFRTGDYEMALTFGKWMLEAKPREISGHGGFTLDRQFERMIDVYAGLGEAEEDPVAQRELFNKAVHIFDLAKETFTEGEIDYFRWTYRKGRFLQENRDYISNAMDQAYEQYLAAYEMDRERFVEAGDGYYARILLGSYVSAGDREAALAMIEEIEPIASASLRQAIEDAREELFSDPEERVVFLEERLEGSDNPEEVLIELASLYDRMGDRQKALETAQRLYEANPNFANTKTLADIALSNANYRDALRYLEEAAEKAPGNNERKTIYLQMAETHQNMDNLRSARDFARRAINTDSNFGEAYLRMSSIYAAVISSCTSGRSIERDDRTVYWLVLDYLDRAGQVDPSVRNAANRRKESYRPVMPTTEDKFFRGWETGESFRIDGSIGECYAWINETTTIR